MAALRRFLAAVGVCLALAGCTLGLAEPGPAADAPGPPALADDALVTSDGYALPLRKWGPGNPNGDQPAKAVIVALHGFNDYSHAFDGPATWWAERGILTYAYDQRTFGAAPERGLWASGDRLARDAAEAVAAVRARHPGLPVYLLGISMGGAVAMVAMTELDAPPEVDGVILAAPAVWARGTMPFYQRWALWLGANTVPWLTVTGSNLDILASDNLEMLRALGRDPLFIKETRIGTIAGLVDLMTRAYEAAPRFEEKALILYGEKDEIVPWPPTQSVWRRLPHRALDRPDGAEEAPRQRLALYADGWHMLLRDLQAEVVWRDIARWIEDSAAPLPSDADDHALAALADPDFQPTMRQR